MVNKLGAALTLVVALLAGGSAFADDTTATEKKAVEAIIRSMYAKKIRDMEFWSGNGAALKSCEHLRSIFFEPLLKKDDRGCDVNYAGYFRFPSLDDFQMSDLANSNHLPKSKIVSSSVNGTTAVVKVLAPIDKDMPNSRVVYFLRKTEQVWRIENFIAYRHWPLEPDVEYECSESLIYTFALPPKAASDL